MKNQINFEIETKNKTNFQAQESYETTQNITVMLPSINKLKLSKEQQQLIKSMDYE